MIAFRHTLFDDRPLPRSYWSGCQMCSPIVANCTRYVVTGLWVGPEDAALRPLAEGVVPVRIQAETGDHADPACNRDELSSNLSASGCLQ